MTPVRVSNGPHSWPLNPWIHQRPPQPASGCRAPRARLDAKRVGAKSDGGVAGGVGIDFETQSPWGRQGWSIVARMSWGIAGAVVAQLDFAMVVLGIVEMAQGATLPGMGLPPVSLLNALWLLARTPCGVWPITLWADKQHPHVAWTCRMMIRGG